VASPERWRERGLSCGSGAPPVALFMLLYMLLFELVLVLVLVLLLLLLWREPEEWRARAQGAGYTRGLPWVSGEDPLGWGLLLLLLLVLLLWERPLVKLKGPLGAPGEKVLGEEEVEAVVEAEGVQGNPETFFGFWACAGCTAGGTDSNAETSATRTMTVTSCH